MWLADIFSRSVNCLFPFLYILFDTQKISIYSTLVDLSSYFADHTFSVISKKSLSNSMSWRFTHFTLKDLEFGDL
jgi:hypothetical protein